MKKRILITINALAEARLHAEPIPRPDPYRFSGGYRKSWEAYVMTLTRNGQIRRLK